MVSLRAPKKRCSANLFKPQDFPSVPILVEYACTGKKKKKKKWSMQEIKFSVPIFKLTQFQKSHIYTWNPFFKFTQVHKLMKSYNFNA